MVNNIVNLAVIGGLGSGKSTTTGHMIYQCGGIDKRTIEKNEKEAADLGNPSLKFAFLLDNLPSERERGITIDFASWTFETPIYRVNVTDCPSHRDFTKNMITGTVQADCAILVISAADEFEASISKGGQAREHALIALALGVRQLIVAVNKMDTCHWSEDRYNKVVEETSKCLKQIGYRPKFVPFVPISGLHGDNLLEPVHGHTWYKGWRKETRRGALISGKNLLDAIDAIEPPNRVVNKPLRLPVRNVYNIPEVGTIVAGCVETGNITPGMVVTFAPSNVTAQVESVECFHQPVKEAHPGDNVGLKIKGISTTDIRRGSVIGDGQNDSPTDTASFTAKVRILKHPGHIRAGYTPIIDCHTAHIACEFVELQEKIDQRTGKLVESSPEFLKAGDTAVVKLVPSKPMCVETFAAYASLGRFIVRDLRQVVGIGTVQSVEKSASATC